MSDVIFKQNEAMIGLLARSTIGVSTIYAIVTKNKKNPKAYLNVYNALRGDISVGEAAKLAGVKGPTISVILSSWETHGIIYNIGESSKPQYVRLLKLPDRPPED